MSKLKSKYDDIENGICPFCELPVAPFSADAEYNRRLEAANDNRNDPALLAWADTMCWYGWGQPGECKGGMCVEDRLIAVLDERDAARERIARLERVLAAVDKRLEESDVEYEDNWPCGNVEYKKLYSFAQIRRVIAAALGGEK